MKFKFTTMFIPFMLALNPTSSVAQEYPSPMCHNFAVICSSNYVALGYASAVSCFDAMTAELYCPPPPDGSVNIDRRYDFYVRDDVNYCIGRIDCGGGSGPITPPGPIEN